MFFTASQRSGGFNDLSKAEQFVGSWHSKGDPLIGYLGSTHVSINFAQTRTLFPATVRRNVFGARLYNFVQ